MKRFTFSFEPIEGRDIREGDFAYDPVFGIGNVVMLDGELCFQSIKIKNKGTITTPIIRNLDDKRPYQIVSIIEKKITMPNSYNAIQLVAEGEYAIVKIEVNGKWVELIRERLDSPFSHIIEPTGIEAAVKKS